MKKIINLILIAILVLIPIRSTATEEGHTKTVQITAKPGYEVTDVIVNGESKGPLTSYTFSDVLSPQSLEVITQPIGYTVTFNANGGEGAMEEQIFNKISGKLNANAFSKEKYVFNGWSTTADGEVEYRDGDICFLLEDKILYAVWGLWGDANNDGILDINDVICIDRYLSNIETEINLINADMNKDHKIDNVDLAVSTWGRYGDGSNFPETEMMYTHSFLGYGDYTGAYRESFIVPEGTGIIYWYSLNNSRDKCKPGDSQKFTSDKVWLPFYNLGGTVTFNANGGIGEEYTQAFKSGVEDKLVPNTFTRDGYIFIGWATSVDGEVIFKNQEKISPLEDLTLYAVWELYGDLDMDGTIALADVLIFNQTYDVSKTDIKYVVRTDNEIDILADVNQDGFIDRLDQLLLSSKQGGEITVEFPYTGIAVYTDDFIHQLSDSSFSLSFDTLNTDCEEWYEKDIAGYYLGYYGKKYLGEGKSTTISTSTKVYPIFADAIPGGSSGGSSGDASTCKIYVAPSLTSKTGSMGSGTTYTFTCNGTTITPGQTVEVPYGSVLTVYMQAKSSSTSTTLETNIQYGENEIYSSSGTRTVSVTGNIPVVDDLMLGSRYGTTVYIQPMGSTRFEGNPAVVLVSGSTEYFSASCNGAAIGEAVLVEGGIAEITVNALKMESYLSVNLIKGDNYTIYLMSDQTISTSTPYTFSLPIPSKGAIVSWPGYGSNADSLNIYSL